LTKHLAGTVANLLASAPVVTPPLV